MESEQTLRAFITIEKKMVRDGLLYHLLNLPEFDLVGDASNGFDTLKQLGICKPDMLIVDEDLSDQDGLTVSEIALSNMPTLNIILLVDSIISDARLAIYLDSGIKSVVAKTQSIDQLIKTVRYVQHGQTFVDPNNCLKKEDDLGMNAVFKILSHREIEVAMLLASQVSIKKIAELLCVSPKTVHTYKDRILIKMQCDRMQDLVLRMKRIRNRSPLMWPKKYNENI